MQQPYDLNLLNLHKDRLIQLDRQTRDLDTLPDRKLRPSIGLARALLVRLARALTLRRAVAADQT